MKIGIFTSDFPYKVPFIDEVSKSWQWGGVGEVVYHLALSLNEMGHEIKIFTTSSTFRDQIYKFENIEVYRCSRLFQVGNTGFSLKFLLSPLKYDLDVVNGHRGAPLGALSAYIYSVIKKRPLLLSVHGPYRKNESDLGSFTKRVFMAVFKKVLYGRILKRSKAIVALSDQSVEDSAYLGEFMNKVHIVPNGIDFHELKVDLSKEDCRNLLGLPLDAPVILFVGNLSKFKGFQVLLDAIPYVVKQNPTVKVLFIGKGELENDLARLSLKTKFDKNVIFCGFIDDRNLMNRYYKAADVFCFPSFREGYPMVLLEASAFGLPLVVSDINVHKAIVINGKNGLFFRAGDEKDLASKINFVLENSNLRRLMGQNSREEVSLLTWENVGKKFERILMLTQL